MPLLETVSGGMDSQYAGRRPADLPARDLVDIRTEDRVHQVQGGSPPPERQAALHRGKVADRLLSSLSMAGWLSRARLQQPTGDMHSVGTGLDESKWGCPGSVTAYAVNPVVSAADCLNRPGSAGLG